MWNRLITLYITLFTALTRIYTALEEIKVQNQTIIINQQHQMAKQTNDNVMIVPLPNGIQLPLESIEQLLHLDVSCQDSDTRSNLVR